MMKVKQLMTSPVQYCSPENNLATAAMEMWDSDCGILPVVNREGKVVGLITDRDICMAAATKHRDIAMISVWEAISGNVYSCLPDDDLNTALETMAKHRVRRLPVVDQDGVLQGMIAMNDLVLQAEDAVGKKMPELSYGDVMKALKAISGHRVLVGI
ncbi:CBS domain-containing protein [Candidatus Nitrospira bockiana]